MEKPRLLTAISDVAKAALQPRQAVFSALLASAACGDPDSESPYREQVGIFVPDPDLRESIAAGDAPLLLADEDGDVIEPEYKPDAFVEGGQFISDRSIVVPDQEMPLLVYEVPVPIDTFGRRTSYGTPDGFDVRAKQTPLDIQELPEGYSLFRVGGENEIVFDNREEGDSLWLGGGFVATCPGVFAREEKCKREAEGVAPLAFSNVYHLREPHELYGPERSQSE